MPLEPLESAAAKAVAGARARLVLGRDAKSVFFATLALRLRPVACTDCPTMATDGKVLKFNPSFVVGLTNDELVGVVAHEVMHNAMAHHCRRGTRDPERWNIACDLAVNPLLIDAGFVLPEGRLIAGEGSHRDLPTAKSAEDYYRLLPATAVNGGAAHEDPGGCGSVQDAGRGSPAEMADQQGKWEAAVAQAEVAAHAKGNLPAGLARTVSQVVHSPADWRAVLREFLSSTAKNDYSWSKPNRRFIADGLYLPGLRSEELGEVVIAVDTSGSIGASELAVFGSELDGILGSFDCSATILYHDSAITRVDEWYSTDGAFVLHPEGGGGTSHRPVFEWIEREGRNPACVVCLTDLETRFPHDPPSVPVLWAVVGDNRSRPSFGQVVHIAE